MLKSNKQGAILTFDFIALCQTGIVVMSTVIPISFFGVLTLLMNRDSVILPAIYYFKNLVDSSYLPPTPVSMQFSSTVSSLINAQNITSRAP
jgi:hypothetical protein